MTVIKPVSAEALQPGSPDDLWHKGETSRRVKDLAAARSPKCRTCPRCSRPKPSSPPLVEGCADGTFVLRLPCPNKTFRTWWRSKPDDAALADAALELVFRPDR